MPSPNIQCSEYLRSPSRTLYDACREAGRDRGGAGCPVCGVKDICDADRVRAGCRDTARDTAAAS